MGAPKPKLEYFGTSLREAGHYFWTVGEHSLYNSNLGFNRDMRWADMPFDPERLGEKHDGQLRRGDAVFFHIKGYTICYIEGSPKDLRGGCKSVFFIEGIMPFNELQGIMQSSAVAIGLLDGFGIKINYLNA